MKHTTMIFVAALAVVISQSFLMAQGARTNIFPPDGNVGIGTTTPQTKLDVSGGTVRISNQGERAVLLNLSNERHWEFRQLGTGAGTALELVSVGGGGNKNFVINTTGRVGIGATSPGAKLDVVGTIRSSSGGFVFPDGTTQTTATLRGP